MSVFQEELNVGDASDCCDFSVIEDDE